MSRILLVAFLAAILSTERTVAYAESTPQEPACSGLSISHFESRFPTKVKRMTFNDAMLETFVELWKAGSRPDLPMRPERVVIYALPGLPLIIGFQERHCIIAYLAVESTVLSRWLHHHLGWNT